MRNYIFKILLFVVLAVAVTACTGMFEKYNSDETSYTEEQQKIDNYWYGMPLVNVQHGIYFNYDWGEGKNWTFQIMQNLNIDLFAGYFHNNKFNDDATNTMYDLNDTWNAKMWEYTYWYAIPEGKKAEDRCQTDMPEFYGVIKIIKVLLLHRISDVYGPVIYKEFGHSKIDGVPDSQRDTYYAFFDDLDQAIEILSDSDNNTGKLARFDILMPDGKKNNKQWMKFANSLRLRLAMRISKVDPEKARTETVKALNSPFGLLEGIDDVVAVNTVNTGYTNPLGEINKVWGEVYMNANMESILTGYEDPRISRFFEPVASETHKGIFRGIRQGTSSNYSESENYSQSSIPQSFNALLMTSAEVWFLRAEAALRGWSDESTKYCYEQGVKVSFARWRSDGVDEYLKSDNIAADYVDDFYPENSIEARCRVSPRWDDGADNETKLEKIITQKWIACYPEGCEAWAEQRRTGYPRLFPVKHNMSNGVIDTEVMIRRLNFPVSIKTLNSSQYEALCKELNGPDTGGTRVWWDTGAPNF
ncbi:SusD/RagB family nutrient-binding outer membrane lipoprotein [Paludibacter sp. 221]|uniref:SusD/RagB family nutrient-binding outer membrane lipoprotein n=1 Tax=Paludibacter sp. 221 TaxID=2302939 RepID=UPI0013D21C2F|nr:SusD/RagB family nutrient-binding outer membrane lipoprotein [Paludibacter sp. 221]NDV46977.1 SusD/RagB family nutrient-binding outer membrane lipoprotein [Paludibacter sp. 221]